MTDDKDKILAQLQKIIDSKTFSKTSTNIKLLRFLVHESLQGAELKEVTIGSEMFGKDYDPIKNDNKVRVYVYHLRKKLDQYYSEEATKGEMVFTIEKGQYSVDFLDREQTLEDDKLERKKGLWKTIVAVVLLVVVISYLVFFNQKASVFWSENFQNEFPTTVLIGDHFTLLATIATGGEGIIRDFKINSESDFNHFIQSNPDKVSEIAPSPYSYITKMGAYCSASLSRYFVETGVNYNLMLNSEWDKSKINSENVVYVGQMKTMRFLKNILEEYYPFYTFENTTITRFDTETGLQTKYTDISTEELVDYTIVAKISAPAGNSYKLFLSNHDGGAISSVNYFIDTDWVNDFYSENEIGNKDFIALFKVSGWERTGYNMEFVAIDFGTEE